MKAALSLLVGIALLTAAGAAAAHHSFAAEFDIARPVKLTGSVTRVEWTNPHAWVFIDVPKEDGTVEKWAFELIGANGLMRRGWTRDTMKAGDRVTVEGFGARDGSNTGNAANVVMTATGRPLYTTTASEPN